MGMKDVREVYSDYEEPFYGPCDYNPLLESFGYGILLQIDDSDYQGDSRVLFQDGDRYGYLIFGWGSCSGCDALQDCDTFADIESLQGRLHNQIHWEESKEALLNYFKTKDWKLTWEWHDDNTQRFIEDAIKLLGEE